MIPNATLREYRRICEEARFAPPGACTQIHPKEVLALLDELAVLHTQARTESRRSQRLTAW